MNEDSPKAEPEERDSRIYLFFPGRILSIVSMSGIACASIPPVSLCLTVCALAIPLAAAAAQEEAAAGQAVENGALGKFIIKACVHGRRNIRCQSSKGIPANVKDRALLRYHYRSCLGTVLSVSSNQLRQGIPEIPAFGCTHHGNAVREIRL